MLCGWQRKGVVPREYTAPDGCAKCVKMSGDEGVSRKECGRRGAGRGAGDYTGILVGHVRTSLLRQSRTTKERDATGHMMLTRLAGPPPHNNPDTKEIKSPAEIFPSA